MVDPPHSLYPISYILYPFPNVPPPDHVEQSFHSCRHGLRSRHPDPATAVRSYQYQDGATAPAVDLGLYRAAPVAGAAANPVYHYGLSGNLRHSAGPVNMDTAVGWRIAPEQSGECIVPHHPVVPADPGFR